MPKTRSYFRDSNPLIINFYLASWKQVGLWHVCVIFGKNEKKNLKVSQRTPNFFRTSGFLLGNLISYQHRTFYRGTFCYLSSCDIFRRCGRRRPEKFSILPRFFFLYGGCHLRCNTVKLTLTEIQRLCSSFSPSPVETRLT